jgi:hypothetical protein
MALADQNGRTMMTLFPTNLSKQSCYAGLDPSMFAGNSNRKISAMSIPTAIWPENN